MENDQQQQQQQQSPVLELNKEPAPKRLFESEAEFTKWVESVNEFISGYRKRNPYCGF
jgi:hypothetical protein